MRQRTGWFGGLSAVILTFTFGLLPSGTWVLGPAAALAQDPEANGAAAAPAAPAAVAQPPAAPKQEDAAPPKQSALMWFYQALGLPYVIVFLPMSFILVALFIMNLLSARRENICPRTLVESFEACLNERKYQEAYELAKADESFLGLMLAAGMAKVSGGYEKAMAAMARVGEEENMKLDHRLGYMALIATLAPMVGLFGTVDGMIRSFIVISNSNATPKPAELAMGISTALVTTVVGLALAIPAMAAFNVMKNRIARLMLEVGAIVDDLMGRFEGVGPTAAK